MFQNNIFYTRKNVAFSICFIFFAGILFSQEFPRIVDDKIIFLDGVTQIHLSKNDSYHIFPQKNRVVYIQQQMKSNYGEYILSFYDFNGKKIAQPDTVTGEIRFVFAEVNQRVLAGQIAVLTRQNRSYLYDLDGNLLNVLNHDYDTKQIGITADEKYFWFAANKMRPLSPGEKPFLPNLTYTPYNHIMVFDVHTGNFLMDYSTLESNFSFFLDGEKYTIFVMPPDLPG
jgi:hypothetical protein